MSWSNYKSSWGYLDHKSESKSNNNAMNRDRDIINNKTSSISILSGSQKQQKSQNHQFRSSQQSSPHLNKTKKSSKSSKSSSTNLNNNNNNNNHESINNPPDDFIFLNVKNWSQCSRCLWHYDHLFNPKGVTIRPDLININRTDNNNNNNNNNNRDRSQPFTSSTHPYFRGIGQSHLHSPNANNILTESSEDGSFTDNGDRDVSFNPPASLSPLRLSQQNAYTQSYHNNHKSQSSQSQSSQSQQNITMNANTNSQSPHQFPPNKKCESSPLTPSYGATLSGNTNHNDNRLDPTLQFGANMVKSRSLPNIQDAMSPPFGHQHKTGGPSHHHSPYYANTTTAGMTATASHHSQFKYGTHSMHIHGNHSKQSLHRRYNVNLTECKRVDQDNVTPIGYGSINEEKNSIMNRNRECKDNKQYSTPPMFNMNDVSAVNVTQNTSLRFIYDAYRIVITLDISSSIGVMNPTTRCVTFEHYYPMLRDFLYLISQPIEFDCLVEPIFPILYVNVVAVGLPDKQLISLMNEEIKCSWNRKHIDSLIYKLYDEFQKLEQKCVEQLVSTHEQNTRLNVDWEDIIHHSLFCLDRMPCDACPNIVVITNGILTLEQHTGTYGGGVLAQVLRRDVSVNTLQSCERQFSPNAPFGHVPDSDLLEFFCRFTNGILLDHKTLHQQRLRQKKREDILKEDNLKDKYNETIINEEKEKEKEEDSSLVYGPFHHYKHTKSHNRSPLTTGIMGYSIEDDDDHLNDDDDFLDNPLTPFMSTSLYDNYDLKFNPEISIQNKMQNIVNPSLPAKWFRNKVDSLFKEDNLVQLGVLIRSSSLSNQVFESAASSMLASWSILVESRHHRSEHKRDKMLTGANNNADAMGHFDRVQWYKTSYKVTCTRELIIRARTNEGFKNANIVSKGSQYGAYYYKGGHYGNSDQSSSSTMNQQSEHIGHNLMDIMDDTSSIDSYDSKYLSENNQIYHMFHEWKHRVVIEYQMICTPDKYDTRTNIFIIGSKTFLTNLVKYLSQKNTNTGQQVIMQRSQQFAELEDFIHDIKKTDKALSKLVMDQAPKSLIQQKKLSTLLNYLEDRIWHDVIFQDVICLPKECYIDVFDKSPVKIQNHIEKMQLDTPHIWMKVREALKQWATFDLEYSNSEHEYEPEMIKYVRTYPDIGGFAVVVYEQPCDWLISLKIEAQGPQSRRSYRLIQNSVVNFLQQTVQLDKYELKFLDKPIHNLLILEFPDCHKCNSDDGKTKSNSIDQISPNESGNTRYQYHPHIHIDPYYMQEVQLIRSYLHTRNWFISSPQSCVVYLMSMLTDLKLREGFKLIMNHSNGRILGHWIHSNTSKETSFVQLNINRLPKGLHIELATEPTSCKYTFFNNATDKDDTSQTTLSTIEILQQLSKWTERNVLKILSIVGSLYAAFSTIKQQKKSKKNGRVLSAPAQVTSAATEMRYHSETDSEDNLPSLLERDSNSAKNLHTHSPGHKHPPFPSRQHSSSALLSKRRTRGRDTKRKSKLGIKRKGKSKMQIGKIGKKKKSMKHGDKPKIRRSASELSPSSHSAVGQAASTIFDFGNVSSATSNDDSFDGGICQTKYKAKLSELNVFTAETWTELIPIMTDETNSSSIDIDNNNNNVQRINIAKDQNNDNVEQKSLKVLDGILEILQHSDTTHRVFPYQLDYHCQILNEEKKQESDKSAVKTSAQLLSKLLLKTVKRVSDIEIIGNKVYCCGNPKDMNLNVNSHGKNSNPTRDSMDDNLLYIILPPCIYSEARIDALLSNIKPAGEKSNISKESDYLYLFEISKQILSKTTSSSLYDPKEYGIISQIMEYPTSSKLFQQRPLSNDSHSDQFNNLNPSSMNPKRSVTDTYLPRLRQEHDRNKARIIYFDLLNQVNVPMNKIEYAVDKCSQFREDFNISLLKQLMIAQFDINMKSSTNSKEETKKFSNELRNAIESTCCSQFKYIPELDAYFYVPPGYTHRFIKESSNTNNNVNKIDQHNENADDVNNTQIHDSSANDADDNESLDEDETDNTDSSGDEMTTQDDNIYNIPKSEAEKLKTVDKSTAQEKRMHRAKLRGRMREKKTTLFLPSARLGKTTNNNIFNSILTSINNRYNQSAESLIQLDQTSSAPPPEAYASPYTASPATPHNSTIGLRRTSSSPIAVQLFKETMEREASPTTPNTLPYPLFIRFNVIIHGTANRFRSVSINDINEEVLYTQQASAICLNAIIMTTPPSQGNMSLDASASLVSLEDIDSLSMNDFNDSSYLNIQTSHSLTALSGHKLRNPQLPNILPALDTQNIRKLPPVFIGLYRRFSKSLRAHIAEIILHELKTSRPINSEIVLQQLALLEPVQYHLFSHKIRFVGERCFQLLPQYMSKVVVPDIKLEYVKMNLSQIHRVNMWYALKINLNDKDKLNFVTNYENEEGAQGKEQNDDDSRDNHSIPYWVLICIPEDNHKKKTTETGRECNVSFLVHINSKDLSSYRVDRIEQKFRDCIDKISFLINQQALLQKLNETKEADNWLIPPPTESTVNPTYKQQSPTNLSLQHSNPSDSLVTIFHKSMMRITYL